MRSSAVTVAVRLRHSWVVDLNHDNTIWIVVAFLFVVALAIILIVAFA